MKKESIFYRNTVSIINQRRRNLVLGVIRVFSIPSTCWSGNTATWRNGRRTKSTGTLPSRKGYSNQKVRPGSSPGVATLHYRWRICLVVAGRSVKIVRFLFENPLITSIIPISLCLRSLSLSTFRITVMRMRMRVAGLAFVIKHANLRNIRQNNLLTFGKTSR